MLMKREDGTDKSADKSADKTLGERLTAYFTDLFRREPKVSANEAFDGALSGLAESVKSIVNDDGEADREDMLAKSFAQFHEHVSPLLGDRVLQQPTDKQGELPMSAILKALGLAEDASEEDALKAIAEMAKARRKENGNDEEEEEDEEDDDEKKREKAFKALPEAVRKQIAAGEDAIKRVQKLEDETQLATFTKRAVEAGLPASEGATLQKLSKVDPEAADKLLAHAKAGWTAAKEAGAFREIGASGGGGGATTAYDQFSALAQKYLKDHPDSNLTSEQAFAKVYQDPANKALRIQEARESGRA